ncbi:metallophosphoesterase [Pseudarthrobacter sp. J1738]|uniref:metallophosphoesterase n=1 Tax=unclassified Pseudarthrobacter TaxID=2647000 RepID=UPI003D2A7CB1
MIEPAESARYFAVGDIHGALKPLLEELSWQGLVDSVGRWQGGNSHVYFLGDYLDRGPHGLGVIDVLMQLEVSAREAGGGVHALLGNHEVLALGTKLFGTQALETATGPRNFHASWVRNGGQNSDQEGLSPRHVQWLMDRPAVALAGTELLLHSDTTAYLEFGSTVSEVNTTIGAALRSENLEQLWNVWARMTTRGAFRGVQGHTNSVSMLNSLGGERIIHGHSIISEVHGYLAFETAGPEEYAGGLAVDIDAGLYDGGPCLVFELIPPKAH